MPAGYVPRCYDAHWDQDTGGWHLLFEDLSKSHFVATHWPLPPTLAQCESIIRTRARFRILVGRCSLGNDCWNVAGCWRD